jgi:hypothetical protein
LHPYQQPGAAGGVFGLYWSCYPLRAPQEEIAVAIQLASIRWVRVIVTAGVVSLISFILLFGLVTGYATVLGFQARGAPDPALISQFADQVAPWAGPIILMLVTLTAGAWLGRREGAAGPLNGLVVGGLAGLLNLVIGFSLSLGGLAAFVLTAAAGWLGGWLGSRRRLA